MSVSLQDEHIVHGDDWGALRLYRFPACFLNAPHREYYGHGTAITRVAFFEDMPVLVSLGEHDRMICQWRLSEPAPINYRFEKIQYPWTSFAGNEQRDLMDDMLGRYPAEPEARQDWAAGFGGPPGPGGGPPGAGFFAGGGGGPPGGGGAGGPFGAGGAPAPRPFEGDMGLFPVGPPAPEKPEKKFNRGGGQEGEGKAGANKSGAGPMPLAAGDLGEVSAGQFSFYPENGAGSRMMPAAFGVGSHDMRPPHQLGFGPPVDNGAWPFSAPTHAGGHAGTGAPPFPGFHDSQHRRPQHSSSNRNPLLGEDHTSQQFPATGSAQQLNKPNSPARSQRSQRSHQHHTAPQGFGYQQVCGFGNFAGANASGTGGFPGVTGHKRGPSSPKRVAFDKYGGGGAGNEENQPQTGAALQSSQVTFAPGPPSLSSAAQKSNATPASLRCRNLQARRR